MARLEDTKSIHKIAFLFATTEQLEFETRNTTPFTLTTTKILKMK